jgi:anti-sigma regulatory factor (Ser/Thr protein kinase)
MVSRKFRQGLKRQGKVVAFLLAVVFGGLWLWQAWDVATHLRHQARDTAQIYGEIISSLNDPGTEAAAMLNMAEVITETGVPIVLTNRAGMPYFAANLPAPFKTGGVHPYVEDTRQIREYIAELDRRNPPIRKEDYEIHYGVLPVTRRYTSLGYLQLGVFLTAALVGVWAYRTSVDRHRDRLWVAMARESAHQLGTPLMSADAWVDRLTDLPDEKTREIAGHLTTDLERLRRVAKRFERIGRPARHEKVALGVLAERVAAYFEPRLPKHANRVQLTVQAPESGPTVNADPVLIEWALEALVRNSVDALSGRGGSISVTVEAEGKNARITVADDGPGIPIEVRNNLFEPGTSTKSGGWGIGLALARRIVEDVHGGRLELVSNEGGATFVATVPTAGDSVRGE